MNIISNVAKNTLILIVGNVADMLLNLLISVSLARYFGQNGFGKLSFLAIFFFFLGSLDSIWIKPILIREMSKDENKCAAIFGNGLLIKGSISIVAILIFWLTIWLLKPPTELMLLAFFTSLGLLLTSIISSYETIFQIKLRMVNFVILNLLSKIVSLILILIIAFYKGDIFLFYSLSFIPSIILLVQVRYYAEKIIKPRFKIYFKLWGTIFKASWPLGLSALFIFMYHRIDQILLFYFKGPDKVGLYSAATKVAESFTIVALALMTTVLPLMSRYYELSKGDFDKIYQISFKYLLIFILPVACYISIFSSSMAKFFYGKVFLDSSPALSILIWAEVFVFLGVVNNSILIASGKQRLDPIFTGVSALVNITLNLVLIPKFSFIGAAVASLVSYSVGPILGYFIPSTRIYSYHMLYYSLRPLLASLLMACFIFLTREYFLISIIASPFIYLLVLYYLKGISQDDIHLVKSIVSTRAAM